MCFGARSKFNRMLRLYFCLAGNLRGLLRLLIKFLNQQIKSYGELGCGAGAIGI